MARYARIATVTCGGGQREETAEQTVVANREAQLRLLDREPDARNRALLRLLYAGGLWVSEACALRWGWRCLLLQAR